MDWMVLKIGDGIDVVMKGDDNGAIFE